MKRIFSLVFALCLCLSLFTACNGESGGNADKTTVSEAEWNAAFLKSNVSIEGFVTERDQEESLLMQITESVIHTENDGYESWVLKQEDGWHFYRDGQVGPLANGVSASISYMMQSFHLPGYASFSYNEESGAYVYINEGESGFYRFDVYFTGGVIVKIEGYEEEGPVSHLFNFKDYGTTELQLPNSQ